MYTFPGFSDSKTRLIRIPEPFFTQLLPIIDDLDELRVTLYIFWRIERMEGSLRYLRAADLHADEQLLAYWRQPTQTPHEQANIKMEAAHAALDQALLRAVQRGALLHAQIDMDERQDVLYFINSARGRAAIQAIQRGEWRPSGEFEQPVEYFPGDERPNIFSLYEQHFGPLTPMIAEALRSAENDYPASWIEDAMRIAVQNNKRSWSYTEAILRRWQEGGRDDREDRRDLEKDRRRYAEWDQPRRK